MSGNEYPSKKPVVAEKKNARGARSIQRILEAAARLFGREGFQGASMLDVARAAGVSKGLLHYHFQSKEHLLIEAQRATFRQLHRRFEERSELGERGLDTAIEALDAIWSSVRDMRTWTPFMVETMSLSNAAGPLREDVRAFYEESTELLRTGVERVFSADQHEQLILPPDRIAYLIRVILNGMIVELSFARGPEDLARVDQAYVEFTSLFRQVALSGRDGVGGPPPLGVFPKEEP